MIEPNGKSHWLLLSLFVRSGKKMEKEKKEKKKKKAIAMGRQLGRKRREAQHRFIRTIFSFLHAALAFLSSRPFVSFLFFKQNKATPPSDL